MVQPSRAEAEVIALNALAFVVADAPLRGRFLELSGIAPGQLRQSLDAPETQAALLAFLAAHEPDMIACAKALDLSPERLATALNVLESRT